MGRLIVSAQMTIDGVMDQIEDWFDATLESSFTESTNSARPMRSSLEGRPTRASALSGRPPLIPSDSPTG